MSNKAELIFKKESKAVAESLLRNGAKHIGGQLMNAVSNVDRPSDIVFGSIVSALRYGAIATGQEVLKERLQSRR